VNDREGRFFVKFAGVGAKGTKLKETAWEEVASMINRFVFAHPNIYRNHAFKRKNVIIYRLFGRWCIFSNNKYQEGASSHIRVTRDEQLE
jgi:hypothetical protein